MRWVHASMFGQSRPEGAPSGIAGLLGIRWLLASRRSLTTGCGSNAWKENGLLANTAVAIGGRGIP
jgi:hypothetical protein